MKEPLITIDRATLERIRAGLGQHRDDCASNKCPFDATDWTEDDERWSQDHLPLPCDCGRDETEALLRSALEQPEQPAAEPVERPVDDSMLRRLAVQTGACYAEMDMNTALRFGHAVLRAAGMTNPTEYIIAFAQALKDHLTNNQHAFSQREYRHDGCDTCGYGATEYDVLNMEALEREIDEFSESFKVQADEP